MPTIYGKFPVILPGLTESISRNGLKFINGSTAYIKDDEQAAITLAEGYGSLFPRPISRNTGLGFWELNFQAVIFTGEINKLYGNESVTLEKQNAEANYGIKETWIIDTITEFKVINSYDKITDIPSNIVSHTFFKKLKKREITGTLPAGVSGNLNISWPKEIKSIVRRNFGILDECDIVYGLAPTVS